MSLLRRGFIAMKVKSLLTIQMVNGLLISLIPGPGEYKYTKRKLSFSTNFSFDSVVIAKISGIHSNIRRGVLMIKLMHIRGISETNKMSKLTDANLRNITSYIQIGVGGLMSFIHLAKALRYWVDQMLDEHIHDNIMIFLHLTGTVRGLNPENKCAIPLGNPRSLLHYFCLVLLGGTVWCWITDCTNTIEIFFVLMEYEKSPNILLMLSGKLPAQFLHSFVLRNDPKFEAFVEYYRDMALRFMFKKLSTRNESQESVIEALFIRTIEIALLSLASMNIILWLIYLISTGLSYYYGPYHWILLYEHAACSQDSFLLRTALFFSKVILAVALWKTLLEISVYNVVGDVWLKACCNALLFKRLVVFDDALTCICRYVTTVFANKTRRQKLEAITDYSNCLALLIFLTSGEYLFTTSFDKACRLWNLKTNEKCFLQNTYSRLPCEIFFHHSQDGSSIIWYSQDGSSTIWCGTVFNIVKCHSLHQNIFLASFGYPNSKKGGLKHGR